MNNTDLALVESFFNLVYVPGYCLEVRAFNAQIDRSSRRISHTEKPFTVAGWFSRADELAAEISRIDNVSVYISVNPVTLSNRPIHAKNNLNYLKKGEFATDACVGNIRYLVIDIDPVRLSGNSKINSNSEELLECLNVRDRIIKDIDLNEYCMAGMSGNGAFILVRLPDYPNDDKTLTEVSRFVFHLSEEYSNRRCVIDTNSKNASRMIGIPGTVKYRCPISTAERPHRRVQIEMIGNGSSQTIRPISMANRPPG